MNTKQQILKKYRRTPKGVLTNIYHKQKERSVLKAFFPPEYSLKEFHYMFLNNKKFNRLFEEWCKSGYKKEYKPSIDRINCKKHYTKDNIQIMTWAENRFKQNMERRSRKGMVAQLDRGKVIKIFKSQREAVRELGVTQPMLSLALTGACKTAYGYEWKYLHENPELLKEKDKC